MKSLFFNCFFFLCLFSLWPESLQDYIEKELGLLFSEDNIARQLPAATRAYPDDKWGKYSAESVFDNKLGTSWVESASGPGVGEQILFVVPSRSNVIRILPGYGRKNIFKVNNRVKKIRMKLDKRVTFEAFPHEERVTILGTWEYKSPIIKIHWTKLEGMKGVGEVIMASAVNQYESYEPYSKQIDKWEEINWQEIAEEPDFVVIQEISEY
ncbi:MAG: hypothetical protein JW969_07475 [Spirochaetales bacterium]|nr:hypothetical protein [Spirochaetales bacterium]